MTRGLRLGVILVILLDQASKFFATRLKRGVVYNQKSLLGWWRVPDWLILLVLLLMIFYWRRQRRRFNFREEKGFLLMISGGVGNLIDRIRLGKIIDFIDIKIWPVFNLADLFITIGLVIIVYSFFRDNPVGERRGSFSRSAPSG